MTSLQQIAGIYKGRQLTSCLYALLLAILLVGTASAQQMGTMLSDDSNDRLSTIPHSPALQDAIRASRLPLVVVNHEGWRETMATFARLKVYQITGRMSVPKQDPIYTVLGMMFQPELWYRARILPVEHPDILESMKLDNKWVSPAQVVDNPLLPVFIQELQNGAKQKKDLDRATNTLNALEQVARLGENEWTLEAFREQDVDPAEILTLRQDAEARRALHTKRTELYQAYNARKPYFDAGERLLNRAKAFTDLPTELLVVPDSEAEEFRWIRPASSTVSGIRVHSAGRDFERTLQDAFRMEKPELIGAAANAFLSVAELSRYYPTPRYREMTNWYVRTNPWRIAAWIYLCGAAILGLYFFFNHRVMYWTGITFMLVGFAFHSAAMFTRFYLTGHVPVSNMFESITFASWSVLLIALIFEAWTRRAMVGLGSMLMGFMLLTGAGLMPLHETRLHPLRAVLNSYWLNIHVTLMLISYAAFAIAAFFALYHLLRSVNSSNARRVLVYTLGAGVPMALIGGLMYVINSSAPLDSIWSLSKTLLMTLGALCLISAVLVVARLALGALWTRTGLDADSVLMSAPQAEEFAYRLVQVGWPILTFGITLGAIWADTAWGRYWGWDPKETWAFITWVAFTVYLHSRMVMGWRGAWSAAACLIGFLMVMITWWGVSYLPWFSGGLHSYASPN